MISQEQLYRSISQFNNYFKNAHKNEVDKGYYEYREEDYKRLKECIKNAEHFKVSPEEYRKSYPQIFDARAPHNMVFRQYTGKVLNSNILKYLKSKKISKIYSEIDSKYNAISNIQNNELKNELKKEINKFVVNLLVILYPKYVLKSTKVSIKPESDKFFADVIGNFNQFFEDVKTWKNSGDVSLYTNGSSSVDKLLELTKNRKGIDDNCNNSIKVARKALKDYYRGKYVKVDVPNSGNQKLDEAVKQCIGAVNKLIEYNNDRDRCIKSLDNFSARVYATVNKNLSFENILKVFDKCIETLLREIREFKDKLVVKEEKKFIEDLEIALSSFSKKKDVFNGAVYKEDSLANFLKKYMVEFTSANLIGFRLARTNWDKFFDLKILTPGTRFYCAAAHFCCHGLMNMYFSKVPFIEKKYANSREPFGEGGMGEVYLVEKAKRSGKKETRVMKNFKKDKDMGKYIAFKASDAINEATKKNREQMKQIKKDNSYAYKENEKYKELKGKINRIATTKVVGDKLVSKLAEEKDLLSFFEHYPDLLEDRLNQGIDKKKIIEDVEKCFENITDDMIEAVNQFHELNMVHRDIKPANFLVYKSKKHGYKCELADHDLALRFNGENFKYIARCGTAEFKPDIIVSGDRGKNKDVETILLNAEGEKVFDLLKKMDNYALWISCAGAQSIWSIWKTIEEWQVDNDIEKVVSNICIKKANKIYEDNDKFWMFKNVDSLKKFLGVPEQGKRINAIGEGDNEENDKQTMGKKTGSGQERKRQRTDEKENDQQTMGEKTSSGQERKRQRSF